MYDIREIKVDVDSRVETGPVQFNDDWPGVFIRGDNATHFAYVLECSLLAHDYGWLTKSYIESLIKILKSADINNTPK